MRNKFGYLGNMFIFRWIKNIVVFGMVIVALWWASGHFRYQGKTYQEWAIQIYRSPSLQEATKDLRMWVGQLLQASGKKIQEGITADDQKKLDALIRGDDTQHQPSTRTVKSSPIPVKK